MLADFLDVQDIIEECCEFMAGRLSAENVCGLWKFSQLYRLKDLETASLRFLCVHFSNVCLQEEFPSLGCEDLSQIFCSFDLSCTRQEDLWLSLVRWMESDPSRKSDILDLSKHLLFGLMEKSFREEQVVKSSLYNFIDKDWATELLFLFGGDFLDSRRVIAYNSTTDRWRRLPLELPDPELAPGDYIQAVHCNKGIFFKRSINCYWLDLNSLRFSRVGHFEKRMPAITVLNGEVHLLGGSYFTSWEVFSPGSNTWRDMWPSLRQGRVYGCAAVVKGRIYVLGGQTVEDKGGVADCEVLDSAKQCWVKIAPMEVGRTLFASVVLDGEIYVVGGQTNGIKTRHCEKYSPATGTWTRLPDLLVARRGHVVVVLEQVVFVIGGETDTTEWLDSEEGSWVETRDLPSPITGAGCCVVPVG